MIEIICRYQCVQEVGSAARFVSLRSICLPVLILQREDNQLGCIKLNLRGLSRHLCVMRTNGQIVPPLAATREIQPILVQCSPSVVDAGPTFKPILVPCVVELHETSSQRLLIVCEAVAAQK